MIIKPKALFLYRFYSVLMVQQNFGTTLKLVNLERENEDHNNCYMVGSNPDSHGCVPLCTLNYTKNAKSPNLNNASSCVNEDVDSKNNGV